MRYALKLTREMNIPTGAVKVSDKKSDAVAYLYAGSNGKPSMRVFYGKQSSPVAKFWYNTEAERAAALKRYFEARQRRAVSKIKARDEEKAWVSPYKVGDIFKTSWGYDQTNVEYFEITKVIGKRKVEIREIAQERETTAMDQGRCVPMPGNYIGKPLLKMVQKGGIRISSCQWASYQEPVTIAGIKVYGSASWSSYA